MLKPFVLRPPSRQTMHRFLLNSSPLISFILCFYMIAHPKGPIERDRIGFGENNIETFCTQTPPPPPPSRQIMHRFLLNSSPLEPFLLCFYMITYPKGPIERERIGFGANNIETYFSQIPPSRQIMHRFLLNSSPWNRSFLCFYMIPHPKGLIERDRIGFGANNIETFCSQTAPPLDKNA